MTEKEKLEIAVDLFDRLTSYNLSNLDGKEGDIEYILNVIYWKLKEDLDRIK